MCLYVCLSLCVCLCVCLYLCVCMCLYVCMCVYVSVSVRMRLHVCVYTYASTPGSLYAFMYWCTYLSTYLPVRVQEPGRIFSGNFTQTKPRHTSRSDLFKQGIIEGIIEGLCGVGGGTGGLSDTWGWHRGSLRAGPSKEMQMKAPSDRSHGTRGGRSQETGRGARRSLGVDRKFDNQGVGMIED